MMNESVMELRIALRSVTAFRDVLEAPAVWAAMEALDCLAEKDGMGALDAYAVMMAELEAAGCEGLGACLREALRWSEGPYAMAADKRAVGELLQRAAERDIRAFQGLANVDAVQWRCWLEELLPELPEDLPAPAGGAPFELESLREAYEQEGAGEFARWKAFVWEEGQLIPVPHPDSPEEGELLGYQRQRQEVIRNTRLLMEGRYVNNVLLYGESGTGKSATVKNLPTLPGMEELRIIEADKENLGGLPALIRGLEGRRQKFIVFIDDLTFDRDDSTYSVLKTILEGGVERRPANVAVYATSNRRHLVRQTISERAGDEMDRAETIREKTSLADRFGIRILFQGLLKTEYLDVVDFLAARQGVQTEKEELHRLAVAWERLHGAQTPRTALQFILSLQGGC